MQAITIIYIIVGYFLLLIAISYFTSRNADNASFFLGNKKSPWYIVAFGMISASLSGVTFISVPGWVIDSNFSYMQMVMGYLIGYFVIANVLMPMYYRLNLTSIYTYLDNRFGYYSYKSGALFFLLSRIIGAAFRLFLVANVLQITVFNTLNIPFELTVIITIILIWLYTFKGGIKTIIWTDSLQTLFMLIAVGVTIYLISKDLNLDFKGLVNTVSESKYSKMFFFESINHPYYFFKQFFAGAFIAIVMTGLDQDMMQKNLSCRNIKEAKKNMYWFSIMLVPVNLIFMSLGVLLIVFSQKHGIPIPERSDDLFPLIAMQGYLPSAVSFFFIIGLVAAAYSSADSALTSLTTSFTVDILNTNNLNEKKLKLVRKKVHVAISAVLVVVILIFNSINNESVISAIFRVAGYTYGPLLGLYSFGLLTSRKVIDKFVPYIVIVSPLLCIAINYFSVALFNGYKFGFELLILNGLITFLGLFLISKKIK
ncbi:MAG: sodium:solute symporter [Bacteroidales bacterium]|jgi:SSS family solute:Na+ symporter|nr:sodium:solute symporter [Bacteroidales bacterium]